MEERKTIIIGCESIDDRPMLLDGDKRPDLDRPIIIGCDIAKEGTDLSVVSRILNGHRVEIVVIDDCKGDRETTSTITEDYYFKSVPTITEPIIERESFKRDKAGRMPSKFGKGKRR